VSLVPESAAAVPGGELALGIVFDIEPGWHIYGQSVSGTGLPTSLAWDLPKGWSLESVSWPPTQSFSILGTATEGYAGKTSLEARLLVPRGAKSGARVAVKVEAAWLACRLECEPGEASLALELPVGEPVPATPGALSLALALLLAFAGGLILNLMPCVLPVLSIKVLAFARRSGEERRPVAQAAAFTAGVLASLWALAGLLAAIRSSGRALGWGFQLQDPRFVVAAAFLFFLIALNLFGVFELGSRLPRLAALASGRGALLSAFLGGFLAVLVSTPCSAPFMGAAIGYALAQEPARIFLVFTSLGLGLALPVAALSAFPGLIERVPKSGLWTTRLRQALGFPMMATVAWLGYVLSSLGGAGALLALIEGLVAAALGAWIWGTWGSSEGRRARVAAAVLGLALASLGLAWAARGSSSGQTRAVAETAPGERTATGKADPFWRPWSEETLAGLRGRGVPVFVDFTASWCLSCQVNEAVALDDPALRRRFAELGVVALKADWSSRDESIARALAALGRASVPLYAYYPPDAKAPVILPELLTPEIVRRNTEMIGKEK
jgi:thiol:disulfide interchange protein DsbD